MSTRIFQSFQKGRYPGHAINTFEATPTPLFLRVDIYGQTFPRFLEEEENPQGEGGSTEGSNIRYLVRCYTVRGQWHIINRIWLACMILYTVYAILCIWGSSRKIPYFLKFDLFVTPHPPPTYKINTQSTRLAEVLSTSTQSRHLWTVPYLISLKKAKPL